MSKDKKKRLRKAKKLTFKTDRRERRIIFIEPILKIFLLQMLKATSSGRSLSSNAHLQISLYKASCPPRESSPTHPLVLFL